MIFWFDIVDIIMLSMVMSSAVSGRKFLEIYFLSFQKFVEEFFHLHV